MAARFPFLDHDGPLALAHRGGSAEQPENTLAAFGHAVALGYRYLETDVQVTSDGELLAFHDDDLERTCGRLGRVADLPWSEVRAARVSGREPIPRLAELLAAFPEARVNIDCKADRAVDPLVAAIRASGSIDRVCVGAFGRRRLRRVRRALGPRLCTSMSPVEVALWRLGWVVRSAGCIQVPERWRWLPLVTARTLRRAHRRGVPVHVWTVDDPDEMARLLDLGVDGIMTDRPTVLRDVLAARGHWPA